MDIIGYGMAPVKAQGPPRAEGYRGDKRWMVRLEGAGAITIYAPTKQAAIVYAAPYFGIRWQDWRYLDRVTAVPTKQK